MVKIRKPFAGMNQKKNLVFGKTFLKMVIPKTFLKKF